MYHFAIQHSFMIHSSVVRYTCIQPATKVPFSVRYTSIGPDDRPPSGSARGPEPRAAVLPPGERLHKHAPYGRPSALSRCLFASVTIGQMMILFLPF